MVSYAGTYRDAGYGDVTVDVIDDRLQVQVGESDVTAAHRLHDTWDLHYAPLDLTLPLTFGTDADGTVREAGASMDATCEPTRFRRVEPGA